jgi:pimeloyl-ACP methyl ester carboxylesterase
VPPARHGDVLLHWEAHGDGEPIVLIMGLGGSSRAWWRLLGHLAPRARAITLDNRGTGLSDPVRGLLHMRDLVGDVLAVMDAAGLDRAHVMGVSMGGMIAQHLALDHRDRVASLILGCTSAIGRRGTPPWRLLGASALRPLLGAERTWPLLAPSLYAPHTLREAPERVEEDLLVRREEATDAWTTYAQLAAIAGHDTLHRLHELAGLGVTVVHGAMDVLVPPERADELHAAIPGSRLELIAGAGHMLTTDAEEASAAAVLAHLERHAADLAPSRQMP